MTVSYKFTKYQSKALAHNCRVCKTTGLAKKYSNKLGDCWNCDGAGVVSAEICQDRRDEKFVIELSSFRSGGFQHSVNDAIISFFAETKDHIKSERYGVPREVTSFVKVFSDDEEAIVIVRKIFAKHGYDFDAIIAEYIADS